MNSNPKEALYPDEFRKQAESIKNVFLNKEILAGMSDDLLYLKTNQKFYDPLTSILSLGVHLFVTFFMGRCPMALDSWHLLFS